MIHRLERRLKLNASVEKLWEFHSSATALLKLTPPSQKIRQVSNDLSVRNGNLQVFQVQQFGIWLTWKARISDVNPPYGFVDTAEQSAFASWRHHHDFQQDGDGSVLIDHVSYEVPMGPFGNIANAIFLHRQLEAMFDYRHEVTKKELDGRS